MLKENISIVIPVYNAEEYLKECLNSIKNQTFKDFKAICINDGSTDSSLQILQEFLNPEKRLLEPLMYKGNLCIGTYSLRKYILHRLLRW